MKNLYLLLITLICGSVDVDGQMFCPTPTALESTVSVWDWTAPFYTFYYKDANGLNVFDSNVPSPFVDDSNNGAPNTGHLETTPPDYLVADGWELLYKNTGGYLPSSGRTEYVDVPSFALYNRYTGLVRTLVYHPTDNSGAFTVAEVRASHRTR